MDDLNDACENVASNYCPKTDSRKVLATPCPKNKNVDNCNSFARTSICKEVETQKLHVCIFAYKSPDDILPLLNTPERRQPRKIRKGRSLILTDQQKKKDLIEKQKKKKVKIRKNRRFPKKNIEEQFKQRDNLKESKNIAFSEFF